jgi:CubicO group peptidase (beta-lactamase class C family)
MALCTDELFGGLPVQEVPGFPTEEVCAQMEAMVEKARWPGFVACAFTGEGALLDRCAFTRASGLSDLQRGTPMNFDTIVRLYSMTKAFVGVGVLLLKERGLLKLDDPVHKHLPEPMSSRFRNAVVACEEEGVTEKVKSHITIRQLLSHTSGMGSDIALGLDALTRKRGRWESLYKELTEAVDEARISSLDAFVEALSGLPLWQHPGREFYYSYGYDVLGFILQHRSGKPLGSFLRREIFDPLGMRDTGFAVAKNNASRLAQLYRHTKSKRFGGDGVKAELHPVENFFMEGRHCKVLSGGGCASSRDGGLTSTLRDYTKFLVTLFNQGIVPGSKKRLFTKASADLIMENHCARVGGLGRDGMPRIYAHNRKGVGLNIAGEIQLPGLEPDKGNKWFDGVPGLIQWGGAATTFYKYQRVQGRPLLLIFFTQVLPQDDGRSCSAAFERMRDWAESHPPAAKRAKLAA